MFTNPEAKTREASSSSANRVLGYKNSLLYIELAGLKMPRRVSAVREDVLGLLPILFRPSNIR